MARKDPRTPEQKIKQLEKELEDKSRELMTFRNELNAVNKQLETFITQLSQEIRLASVIQKSLVPTEIPSIPGFEFAIKFMPSMVLGSDYFDIFELEDKYRYGILLASSTGHGVAALFMSVLLKSTAQLEAKKGMSPGDFVKVLGKEIQTNLKGAGETRLFYAVVDRKDLSVSYAMAGDLGAYVYKNSHDKWVHLAKTHQALGPDSKITGKSETLELEPRDRLVLLSHGIKQIKDKEDRPIDEAQILSDLSENHLAGSCLEWRNEVIFQTQKFMGKKEYPQDFSVLIAGVKDKVAKLRKT